MRLSLTPHDTRTNTGDTLKLILPGSFYNDGFLVAGLGCLYPWLIWADTPGTLPYRCGSCLKQHDE